MSHSTTVVGLDVHKESIVAAVLEPEARRFALTTNSYTVYASVAAVRQDLAAARGYFESALTAAEGGTGPDVVDAHLGLARCLAAEGRGEESEAHLRAALESHPTEAQRESVQKALKLRASGEKPE